MVEASNILGIDVMVGHWEFTYREDEVLTNVALFKGDFIDQNVRVLEDSLFVMIIQRWSSDSMDVGYTTKTQDTHFSLMS